MNDVVFTVVGIMICSVIIGMIIFTILDELHGINAKLDEILKFIRKGGEQE